MNDHYSNLGVHPHSSQSEIRDAYRKLAREYHPDRNKSDGASDRFLSIKESYETLSNPDRKEVYDRFRNLRTKKESEERQNSPTDQRFSKPTDRVQTAGYFRGRRVWESDQQLELTKEEFLKRKKKVQEMENLAKRGKIGEAALLASELAELGVREGQVYGVLGDAARLRGDFNEAAKQYGFAVQFEPQNEVYQTLHIEMMEGGKRSYKKSSVDSPHGSINSFIFGLIVLFSSICYTAIAKEVPLAPTFDPLSTWTLGQVVSFMFAGVAVGGSLSASKMLDHFDLGGGAVGYRFHPGIMVGIVSVVNFWLGLGLYIIVGVAQRAFNQSVSRLVAMTTLATVGFAFARFGFGWDAVGQTIFWAGSIIYLAGLVGWLVADSLRRVL